MSVNPYFVLNKSGKLKRSSWVCSRFRLAGCELHCKVIWLDHFIGLISCLENDCPCECTCSSYPKAQICLVSFHSKILSFSKEEKFRLLLGQEGQCLAGLSGCFCCCFSLNTGIKVFFFSSVQEIVNAYHI